MLPNRFLHYKVIEKISSSNMAEIYKVVNTKLGGRQEALKLLSNKKTKNNDLYTRFRTEAEILSSLNNRAIPVVYEINKFKNQPFITMEFVSGKSLLDITEYKILSIRKVIHIGMEIISGLREAHLNGIIHRDLKLSNIMITDTGGVKILDFGLASSGWMTPEKDKGLVIGTIPYMSPEQTRGDQLDQRSDIFSLGICFYELLSGRLPFFDPDVNEVLRRVQNERPRSIREHRPETPDLLEKCVFKCIEKDPRKRFQSLDELSEVILDVEEYLKERGEKIGSTEAVRDRVDLISIDMVAREEEYSVLTRAYFRALSSKGSAIFIQGEAGIGKTRLIKELLKHIDVSKVNVASGQAQPGMSLPYRPISDALRYMLLANDIVSDSEVINFINQQFGRLSPQGNILKTLLLPVASDKIEIEGRENLFDTVTSLLASFADAAPLVMILENLHWADRATLDLAAHITGCIQGRKILLILSYRPADLDRKDPYPLTTFAEIAEEHGKTGDAHLLDLKRLSLENTQHLINYNFPKNRFSMEFIKRIFNQSDGNPLFVLELLKLFSRIGVITLKENEWVQTKKKKNIPVPTRIHDLLSRTLANLNEKELQVLEAGAVEGVLFSSESVGKLINMDRLDVLNILRSLWRRQFIELKGDTYRFNPPMARKVLYKQMMPELKTLYHNRLAKIYSISPPPGLGSPAAVALHYHLGGQDSEAIKYYMEAGFSALNLYADREALEYFDAALNLLSSPAPRVELEIHLNRSEIFMRQGESEKSQEAAEQAFDLAKELNVSAEVGRALKLKGKLFQMNGDAAKAETFLGEAIGYSQSPSDRAEILNLLGLCAENRGDHTSAMQRFNESLAISKAAGERLRVSQTLNHMGRTFLNQGDLKAALIRFKKALDFSEALGDRRGIAVNINNLGMLLRRIDHLNDSIKLLFRATRIFKEIGYPNGAANSLRNVGAAFLAQGHRKKAVKFVDKAAGIFEKIRNQLGISFCRLSQGNMDAEAGLADSAFENFTQSIKIGEKIDYPRVVGYGLASQGALEVGLGLPDLAMESLKEAEKYAIECGDMGLSARVSGHRALALCILGDCEAGHTWAQMALNTAEKSQDPGLIWESNLVKCRTALLTFNLPSSKACYAKAVGSIKRTARPSKRAELHFISGCLDLSRHRPLKARRRFETALAMYKKLDQPLKILECLHGLSVALSPVTDKTYMTKTTYKRQQMIQRVSSSILSPDMKRRFQAFQSKAGLFSAFNTQKSQ